MTELTVHKLGVTRVQPPQVVPRYSHRDGEREKPTIASTFGVYIIEEPPFDSFGTIIDVVVRPNGKAEWLINKHDDYSDDLPDGYYWGPITGPWDEAPNVVPPKTQLQAIAARMVSAMANNERVPHLALYADGRVEVL